MEFVLMFVEEHRTDANGTELYHRVWMEKPADEKKLRAGPGWNGSSAHYFQSLSLGYSGTLDTHYRPGETQKAIEPLKFYSDEQTAHDHDHTQKVLNKEIFHLTSQDAPLEERDTAPNGSLYIWTLKPSTHPEIDLALQVRNDDTSDTLGVLYNNRGISPCDLARDMREQCETEFNSTVTPTKCSCNNVFFNIWSACVLVQVDGDLPSFSAWGAGCKDASQDVTDGYMNGLDLGTPIPIWAFMGVPDDGKFNVSYVRRGELLLPTIEVSCSYHNQFAKPFKQPTSRAAATLSPTIGPLSKKSPLLYPV
ncbi:hypothetical protein BDZ94DRAFT_1315006 [Collybia nuda]|uniref:Uncharacterized protein n=1 Tax=Collybia nuda TaxID=64659 RepID=A0A9P5XVN9_9AGAR|nr:hypothetical protein BDZ94DRAFT_1315006 [Collybia nuda]